MTSSGHLSHSGVELNSAGSEGECSSLSPSPRGRPPPLTPTTYDCGTVSCVLLQCCTPVWSVYFSLVHFTLRHREGTVLMAAT